VSTETNPAILKLARGADLSQADKSRLEQAMFKVRELPARVDVIGEGDRPEDVHIVLEGFAFRYKVLPDGSRQIMALLVPGDFCDLHVAILGAMDHSIGTLSACRMAFVSSAEIAKITDDEGGPLNRALWWATLVDEGILREWMVGMGRRQADKQIAHLFCELLHRLRVVGLADGNRFDFPVSQEALADIVGMSTVHVNRVLQQLRQDGLITLEDRVLTVLDEERLAAFGDFNPNYLHLTRRS
jgi:CRP-like cAMP-binding protein